MSNRILLAIPFFAASLMLACDSSDNTNPDATSGITDSGRPDLGRDAGDAGFRPDAASSDTGTPAPDAEADAGTPPNDAGEDAGVDTGTDAGEDAGLDASADAGDDAGSPLHLVYATFGSALTAIDPDTAQLSTVGILRNAADESELYTDVVMTWSVPDQEVLLITSYLDPMLATADRCTGLVTLGPTITRVSSPNLVVEGIAVHSDGTIYVSAGNPASQQSPLSTHVGILDRTSGAITDLGSAAATLQNDVDQLFFRDDVLYGIDVHTAVNRTDLFTMSLTTGATTRIAAPTYTPSVPLRVAYDSSRGRAFSWRAADYNLLEMDLSTALVTAIGQTHTSTSFGNAPSRGFFVAPAPVCPG